MAFTIENLREIFSQGNFQEYVKRLKRIGVLAYDYDNRIGEYTFYGADGQQLVIPSNGIHLEPVEKANTEAAQASVKKHQAHLTNFKEFAVEMAQAGIFSWETNLEKLSTEYYNIRGETTYREIFASVFDD